MMRNRPANSTEKTKRGRYSKKRQVFQDAAGHATIEKTNGEQGRVTVVGEGTGNYLVLLTHIHAPHYAHIHSLTNTCTHTYITHNTQSYSCPCVFFSVFSEKALPHQARFVVYHSDCVCVYERVCMHAWQL